MISQHLERLGILNRALLDAWGPQGQTEHESAALKAYLATRTALTRAYRMFEIANHRIFRVPGGLLVPYDAHGLIIIFVLTPGGERVVFEQKLPHGTIVDDAWIFERAGLQGDSIDLQQ